MNSEAKQFRALADGARKLAERVSEDGAKLALREIAEKYDRLAFAAEQGLHLSDLE